MKTSLATVSNVSKRLFKIYLTVILDWVAPDDFQPEETDTARDFEKNQFLDLRRPMLLQLLRADFSKSYYLQQVHQPRHLSTSAPLFGPVYLEVSYV